MVPDDGVTESPETRDGTGHRSGVIWVGNKVIRNAAKLGEGHLLMVNCVLN